MGPFLWVPKNGSLLLGPSELLRETGSPKISGPLSWVPYNARSPQLGPFEWYGTLKFRSFLFDTIFWIPQN